MLFHVFQCNWLGDLWCLMFADVIAMFNFDFWAIWFLLMFEWWKWLLQFWKLCPEIFMIVLVYCSCCGCTKDMLVAMLRDWFYLKLIVWWWTLMMNMKLLFWKTLIAYLPRNMKHDWLLLEFSVYVTVPLRNHQSKHLLCMLKTQCLVKWCALLLKCHWSTSVWLSLHLLCSCSFQIVHQLQQFISHSFQIQISWNFFHHVHKNV